MYNKDIFKMASSIIEKAYNDIFKPKSYLDSSEYSENVENIKMILEDKKEYLLSRKKRFDELYKKNRISVNNYMLFINIVNAFNKFYNNIYDFINSQNIDALISNYPKLVDNFSFYLKSIGIQNEGENIGGYYSTQKYYEPVDSILGELADLSLKIEVEINILSNNSISKRYHKWDF